MDQSAGEKEEHSSEDPTGHRRRKDDVVVDDLAADVGMDSHGESMSMEHQRDDDEAEEETAAGVVLKEAEVVVLGGGGDFEEEASSSSSAPFLALAHPCSLLQLLLRACFGCLGVHGHCSGIDNDGDPKPASADADDDVATAADFADSPPQEGDHQGAEEVVSSTRVLAVTTVRRKPKPPSRPREGPGGNGGNHH